MSSLLESNKQALNSALQKTIELLNADSGSFFLFDNERKELVLNIISDKRRYNLIGTRKGLGEGVAGSVATKNEAILVRDIKTDPRFNKGSRPGNDTRYHTDSFICVPLVTSAGLVGVMNITDKKSGDVFSQKDFELACLIAKMVSSAIESDLTRMNLVKELQESRAENLRHKESDQEQERFAAMGRVAGNIVHEINGPLDGVMRYTNILLGKTKKEDAVTEHLLGVKSGLEQILNITRSLIEFSGDLKAKKAKEFINVNQAIDQELVLIQNKFPSVDIKVEKIYHRGIPLLVDYGISRVFSNIIKNAFDAMPKSGLLRVCVSCDEQNIKIIFSDTGCGMTEEISKDIFRPFFTTKPRNEGIGLGLVICREIIDRYGGNIEVQSQPNQGTIVTIIIPKASQMIKYDEN